MINGIYRRYGIDFDRLVCQLVPLWLRGPKLTLFLQACVYPLQALSDSFRAWAEQTRIDVSMTSQIIKLEWYFDRMFGKGKVRIYNYPTNTNPCYYRDALNADKYQLSCFLRSESVSPGVVSPLYLADDDICMGASFVVAASYDLKPKEAQIENVINKYKTANKTYKISYI